MNSRIYSNKELIGTDNLEVGDDSMGCLFGEFRPNEKYFQIAQNVIREFWKTQKPDYSKLKSLRLNVQLDNQYFLYPAGGITIEDSIEFPDEPLIIDLAGLDRIIFEEFINKTELPNSIKISVAQSLIPISFNVFCILTGQENNNPSYSYI